jgi:hypothetical protein
LEPKRLIPEPSARGEAKEFRISGVLPSIRHCGRTA